VEYLETGIGFCSKEIYTQANGMSTKYGKHSRRE